MLPSPAVCAEESRQENKLTYESSQKTKCHYSCAIEGCDASFAKRRFLTQHSIVHTGRLPFKCEKCDKRFRTQSHRNRHTKVHNGYPCRQCDFVLETWTALRSHIANTHPKQYKCSQCEKTFKIACRLKEHKEVHDEQRSVFKCPNCSKTFVKKCNLKYHIRVVHDQQKLFPCPNEDCDKKFAYKHSLEKHMKVHEVGYVPSVKKRIQKGKKRITLVSRITGIDPKKSSNTFAKCVAVLN